MIIGRSAATSILRGFVHRGHIAGGRRGHDQLGNPRGWVPAWRGTGSQLPATIITGPMGGVMAIL